MLTEEKLNSIWLIEVDEELVAGGICVSEEGIILTTHFPKRGEIRGRYHKDIWYPLKCIHQEKVSILQVVGKKKKFSYFNLDGRVELSRGAPLYGVVHRGSPFSFYFGNSCRSFISEEVIEGIEIREDLIEFFGLGNGVGLEGCPLFDTNNDIIGIFYYTAEEYGFAICKTQLRSIVREHVPSNMGKEGIPEGHRDPKARKRQKSAGKNTREQEESRYPCKASIPKNQATNPEVDVLLAYEMNVESLSQFNLPVSLPNVHLTGAPSTSTSLKSKAFHVKNSKPGVGDNGFGLSSTINNSAVIGGADFYDPDQPLWGNGCSETSNALVGLNQSKVEETKSSLDVGPSNDHRFGFLDNERVVKSSGAAVGSQSTSSSVWGRINSSKNRSEMREKMVSKVSSSNIIQNELKEELKASSKTINDSISHHAADLSRRTQFGNSRKPSQKAQRTLFVNDIPQPSNKRECLLSFQKFGDVVDMYIPSNSERAFVQFSRRQEAEAALTAPDAVMRNRFIKLWWANRDNIVDDGTNTSNNMLVNTHGVIGAVVPPCMPVVNKGKDDVQSASSKVTIGHSSVAPLPLSYIPKPVVTSGSKAPAPSEKKLETLEVMKEELRKKQQMLDQKRNDFWRQWDKLEKQATGLKGEGAIEQATKKQKVGTVADAAKTATSTSSDPGTSVASPQVDEMADSRKSAEGQNVKLNATIVQEPASSLKQSIRPLAPVGAPFIMNRFKLNKRSTAFKILPPLPPALANVAVLKEQISTFGDLSTVELNDLEPNDGSDDSGTLKSSARIFFTTRNSAEKAFTSGKCWNGQNLQFTWLKPSNPRKDIVVCSENHTSSSKESSDASLTSTIFRNTATSADNESEEEIERRDIGAEEHMEQVESIQSS